MASKLKWLLVLPASIAGAAVCQLLVVLGNWSVPESFDWWVQLVGSIAIGIGFVYAGTWVAPTHKAITSTVLIVIFSITMVSIISIGFNIESGIPKWE